MADYDNSNRVALWLNEKREKQTHPHLSGHGETTVPVWASAWFSKDIADEDKKTLMNILKRYNSKKPFLSISLRPKQASQNENESAPGQQPAPKDDFVDDDIPF